MPQLLTMTESKPEKFLCPKDISLALAEQYGLFLSVQYIREVRSETTRTGAGVFIAGYARVSDVVAWLKVNPNFRAFPSRRRPGCAVA